MPDTKESVGLYQCPDCHKMVSLRATACPHCGGPKPIPQADEPSPIQESTAKQDNSMRWFAWGLVAIIMIGFGMYDAGLIGHKTKSTEPDKETQKKQAVWRISENIREIALGYGYNCPNVTDVSYNDWDNEKTILCSNGAYYSIQHDKTGAMLLITSGGDKIRIK